MRKIGKRGKIVLRHAHKLVGLAIGSYLDPVIFKQFEANFSIWQQPHEIEKFFSWNRAGAFFFDLSFTRRADTQLEISGCDRQPIPFRFAKKIRKDRDRSLALDDALSK